MKKLLLSALLATAVCWTGATAEAGAYFGLKGGVADMQIKEKKSDLREFESDWFASGFVGYHFEFFRADVEYTYHPEREYNDKNIKAKNQSVMGNLYFEPPFRSWVQPYIGGGLGANFHDTKVGSESDTNTSFSWQAAAGIGLELTHNVFLDLGYRYIDMGKGKIEDAKFKMRAQEGYAGLRFEF